MKRMKKCLSLVLALCIGAYGLPVFAMGAPAAVKTSLSDEAMAQAVGGNMQAQILSEFGGKGDLTVHALVVSGFGYYTASGCNGSYAFEVTDQNGVVLQTLASGTTLAGSSMYLQGTVTAANNVVGNILRARITCGSIPALTAVATSRHI